MKRLHERPTMISPLYILICDKQAKSLRLIKKIRENPHSLLARRRLLFPFLHAEKVRHAGKVRRTFSACKRGNKRRMHAGKTTVPVD